jgi:hypothetical protein
MNPLTEVERAYAAGVFDGEGCISASINAAGRPQLSITLEMKNPEIPHWFFVSFGGCCRKVVRLSRIGRQEEYIIWSWRVGSGRCRPFLEVVTPYLRLKKPQAQLALAWIETLPGGGRKTPDDILLTQHLLMQEILEATRIGASNREALLVESNLG